MWSVLWSIVFRTSSALTIYHGKRRSLSSVVSAGVCAMVETVGYITIVIVMIFVCGAALAALRRLFKDKKRSPKIAGTAIPEIGEGLDISKRYDIVYSGGDYGGQIVERLHEVRIVGYVGRDDDEAVSKMYMRGRWLVVEFADGRRAYLMPHSIVSLQESAAA